jgi:hypothetical protein
MFLVTSIDRVERTVFDRVWGPNGFTKEVVAACFYDIHISLQPKTAVYPAEVRTGARGAQLDWSDDFQDLMMEHDADFPSMNLLLYKVYCGESVDFPVLLGRAI